MHTCFFVMLYCVCELCVVSLLRSASVYVVFGYFASRVAFSSHVDDSSLSTSLAVACDAHSLLSEQ